jgi:hypothetical protein
MMKRFFTSILVLLMLLTVVYLPRTTLAQDTETYTASDGLTFEHPAGWAVVDEFGFVTISNTEAGLEAEELEPGMMQAFIFGNEALGIAFGLQGGGDLAAAANDLAAVLGETEGVAYEFEETELGAESAYRLEITEEGVTLLALLVDVDGQLVFLTAGANEGDMAQFEADLLNLVMSMRYEDSAARTPSGDAPDGNLVTGEGEVIWQNQFQPGADLDFAFFGMDLVSAGPDDTLYTTDGFSVMMVTQDGEFGTVTEISDASFITSLVAGDEVLWVIDSAETLLVVDKAGNTLATADLTEGLDADAFPSVPQTGHVVGPDGNLYVFSSVVGAEESRGYVSVYDTSGVRVNQFETTVEDEDLFTTLFTSSGFLAFAADGNLLVFDGLWQVGQIINPEDGSVIEARAYDLSEALMSEFSNDMVLTEDGNIILALSNGKLVEYDAEGNPVAEFGRQKIDEEMTGEFAPGEFFMPNITLLSNGDVVAVDTNADYSQIIRVSFEALGD